MKLPESIKTLDSGCFGCCYGLESFESANLSEIPFQAFLTCSSLKDVKLNSGVTKIFRAAFLHCNSLEEITLPESVVYVHPYAFPASTEITCENSEMKKFGINGYRYLQDISITGTNNYEYAFSVLELVNTEREAQGLSPLVMNESLMKTAMQRAAEISACFSHTRPDSSLCFEANPLMIAENVAAGQYSPDQAMDSWMNSDGHRKNILSGNHSTIGIGCFEIGGTLYWTQCFGNGEDTESCPMPANDEITQTISLATEKFGEAMTGNGISFSFGPEKTYSYSFYVEIGDNYLDVSDMTNAKLYLKNAGSYNTIPVNNMGVSWNSSSDDVAAVDSSGKVAAVGGGRAEIKATMKYFTSSAELTVFSDVLGDANDDGVVDAKDRMLLSRYLAKWKDYEAIDIKAADVNQDGEVNAKDRMILARHLAKWQGYETLPLDK